MAGLLLLGIIMEIGIPDFATCDLCLILVGFTFGLGAWQALVFFGALFTGRMLGYSTIYLASKKYGDKFSEWLCNKNPKLENKLISLETKLNKHSMSSLLFTRLGPGFLTAASIASGLAAIRYRQFFLGSAASAVVADGTRVVAGSFVPQGAVILGMQVQTWQIVLVVTLGIAVFWFGMAQLQSWAEKKWPHKFRSIATEYIPRSCPIPPEKQGRRKKKAAAADVI
jgi:membrane protein DedA with SNARE-associated domain